MVSMPISRYFYSPAIIMCAAHFGRDARGGSLGPSTIPLDECAGRVAVMVADPGDDLRDTGGDVRAEPAVGVQIATNSVWAEPVEALSFFSKERTALRQAQGER